MISREVTFTFERRRGDDTNPPPEKRWVGWRALHRVEGGRQDIPDGMPAVLPPVNAAALKMTAAIQFMGYSLMQYKNEFIDGDDWTKVHGHDVAWCNNQGFGDPGDKRANFILGQDLFDALPKYDKMQRLMQGSFVRGETAFSVIRMVQNAVTLVQTAPSAIRTNRKAWMQGVRGLVAQNVLRCTPGVHGIDSRVRPYPSNADIIENNWFVYSVSIGQRDPRRIDHFPQGEDPDGNQHPVIIPFIFDRVIDFPLEWFTPWDETYEPDPTVIYLA